MTAVLPTLSSCAGYPGRIVCLTDETTETLYLLGEQDRIVGVSAYARKPPEARSKPRVSAFKNANLDAILALKPDLVLTFSDVQAEITRNLVLRGVTVLNFNQRSIAEILQMIAMLSRIVGKDTAGTALIEGTQLGLKQISEASEKFLYRPRVYFEEWDDPLISGIAWVEELVTIAGGEPVFPELRQCGKAKDRVVDPAEVVRRDPEVIFASWCGKKVDQQKIRSRAGWDAISAIRNGHIYAISSDCILQPGPASLTDGVKELHAILAKVAGTGPSRVPNPLDRESRSCKLE